MSYYSNVGATIRQAVGGFVHASRLPVAMAYKDGSLGGPMYLNGRLVQRPVTIRHAPNGVGSMPGVQAYREGVLGNPAYPVPRPGARQAYRDGILGNPASWGGLSGLGALPATINYANEALSMEVKRVLGGSTILLGAITEGSVDNPGMTDGDYQTPGWSPAMSKAAVAFSKAVGLLQFAPEKMQTIQENNPALYDLIMQVDDIEKLVARDSNATRLSPLGLAVAWHSNMASPAEMAAAYPAVAATLGESGGGAPAGGGMSPATKSGLIGAGIGVAALAVMALLA